MGRNGKETIHGQTMKAVFSLKKKSWFDGTFSVNDLNVGFCPRTRASDTLKIMKCVDCIEARNPVMNGYYSAI